MNSIDGLVRSLFRISNNIEDVAYRQNQFWFVYVVEDCPTMPLHSALGFSHWLGGFENCQERYFMKISEESVGFDVAILVRVGTSEVIICQIEGKRQEGK